jgi:hypothetical protein
VKNIATINTIETCTNAEKNHATIETAKLPALVI